MSSNEIVQSVERTNKSVESVEITDSVDSVEIVESIGSAKLIEIVEQQNKK